MRWAMAESWRRLGGDGCDEGAVSCKLRTGPDVKAGLKGACVDCGTACGYFWCSGAIGGTLVLVGLPNKSARLPQALSRLLT
jgi:hypothetical protein